MIPTPQGWTREVCGHRLTLVAPKTEPIGEFLYVQRFGPLRKARAVAMAWLQAAAIEATVGQAERLRTREGEYAALVPVTGTGGEVRCLVGVVFGDNFTTLLVAEPADVSDLAALESLTRELLEQTTLMLGVRKRRYLYRPPHDWQPLANVFVTNWYPPRFPQTPASITVFPAQAILPRASEHVLEASIAEERARGCSVKLLGEPLEVAARDDLRGRLWRLEITPEDRPAFTRELVVFEDAAYFYPLRLDSDFDVFADESQRAFRQVFESVEPFAAGSRPNTDAFAFWVS